MTAVEVLFGLLGVVAVAAALLVVTTAQLVHAALWLVVTLGALAGCYLLLSAEFVAWVQVLIYVGAVVVLLLFGLMLTRAPIGVSTDLDAPPLQRVAAAVVALGSPAWCWSPRVDAFGGERIELGDDPVRGSSAAAGDGDLPQPGCCRSRCSRCCCSPRWSARSCSPAATSARRRGSASRRSDR